MSLRSRHPAQKVLSDYTLAIRRAADMRPGGPPAAVPQTKGTRFPLQAISVHAVSLLFLPSLPFTVCDSGGVSIGIR